MLNLQILSIFKKLVNS